MPWLTAATSFESPFGSVTTAESVTDLRTAAAAVAGSLLLQPDRKLKGILECFRTVVSGNIPLSTSERLSDDNDEDVDGDRLGSTTTLLLFSSVLETVFDFSRASDANNVIAAVAGNVCDFRAVSSSRSGSSCGGANLGLFAATGGGGAAAFFLRPKQQQNIFTNTKNPFVVARKKTNICFVCRRFFLYAVQRGD